MKSIRIFTALILVIVVVLNDFASVQAAQPPPSSFSGTVKWSGSNVPVGTTISARINSVEYASTTATFDGTDTVYALAVPGDDPDTLTEIEGGVAGDTVVFYIGGAIADQSASWVSDTNVALNLTATVTHTLAVSTIGSGTVTSSPAGINCGAICSADFDYNTDVTLTATAGAGYTFTGWSGGGCSGTGACQVTMDAARSVTATFTLDTYTLTVSKAGTGSGTVNSSPAGINCGATCSADFDYNTDVTLTAIASAGSTFTGWSGSGCSGTGTCQVTMDAARAVTATFTLNTYTLTVSKAGTGSGTVSSSPAGINCGSSCSTDFDYNTDVTLTAIASAGSTFTGWSGSGCSGTGTCQVTMDAARAVTATFTLNTYSLIVSKTGTGSGTVNSNPTGIKCGTDCSEIYNYNTIVTLTATAAAGSTFTGWSSAGCSGTGTCQVTMDAARSVTAAFTLDEYTLTVLRSGNGSVTLNPNQSTYHYGDVVVLTAVPAPGWSFTGWSGWLTGKTNPETITMRGNRTVIATFTLNTYTLSVNKSGTGSGTVSSSPAGINCGTDCSETYNYNTIVTLTATVAAGSTFTGWSGGGCSGTGTCQVTMDMARSVTATFTLKTYPLTVSKAGTGSGTVSSSPAGINCGSSCSADFDYNTIVTLTAIVSTGSNFTGWSGSGCSGTGACQLTMGEARSVTATFTLNTYTLTVSKAGTGSGMVNSNPTGINCGTDCLETYNYNTIVTLTATAAAGSIFTGWRGGGCSGTGSCQVTMSAARLVTAAFTLDEYTLTVIRSGSGAVTLNPNQSTYHYGDVVVLTAVPAPGWSFAGWSGGVTGKISPQTITMRGNRTVIATFTLNTYMLSVNKSGTGSGMVSSSPAGIDCGTDCSETYNYSTIVTLTATAAAGSTFMGWSGGGCSGTGTCQVTMDMARSVTATFSQITARLSVNKVGRGSGTVSSSPAGIYCGSSCSADFNYKTIVTLTATPAAGSTFTGWIGGGCIGTGTCQVTMDAAKSVTATFALDEYTLTVFRSGSGIVTQNLNNPTFHYGGEVVLTAVPDPGWSFAGWSGDLSGKTNPATLTMNGKRAVVAIFAIDTHQLSISKDGRGSGMVTSAPAGIDCGSVCSGIYRYGKVVSLTANASTGSTFGGWSGACTGTDDCVVTMTAARSVRATFTLNTYTLSVNKLGTGSGAVTSIPAGINCGSDCSDTFVHGDEVTLIAIPSTGSTFTGWSGGGCSGTDNCQLTMDSAKFVTAGFAAGSGDSLDTAPFTILYVVGNKFISQTASGGPEVIVEFPVVDQAQAAVLSNERLFVMDAGGIIQVNPSNGTHERVATFDMLALSGQLIPFESGSRIIYSAVVEDLNTPSSFATVIGAIELESKTEIFRTYLTTRVILLGLTKDENSLVLLPVGQDPEFDRIWLLDIANVEQVDEVFLQGIGDSVASLSPDAHFMVTRGHGSTEGKTGQPLPDQETVLSLYDLSSLDLLSHRNFALPYPPSYFQNALWTGDSQRVYILILSGQPWEEPGESYGLWSFDVSTGEISQVASIPDVHLLLSATSSGGELVLLTPQRGNEAMVVHIPSGESQAFELPIDALIVDVSP